MCDNIGHGKVTAGLVFSGELFVEANIQINFLIARAVERTCCCLPHSTACSRLTGVEDQGRFMIGSTFFLESLAPKVFCRPQDLADELGVLVANLGLLLARDLAGVVVLSGLLRIKDATQASSPTQKNQQ